MLQQPVHRNGLLQGDRPVEAGGDAVEGNAIGVDGGEGLAIDPATVGSEMADGGAAHRDQGVAVGGEGGEAAGVALAVEGFQGATAVKAAPVDLLDGAGQAAAAVAELKGAGHRGGSHAHLRGGIGGIRNAMNGANGAAQEGSARDQPLGPQRRRTAARASSKARGPSSSGRQLTPRSST